MTKPAPMLRFRPLQEAGQFFTFLKFRGNSANVIFFRTSSRGPFSRMDRNFHVRQIFEKFPEREKTDHFFQWAGFQQVTKNFTFPEFSENLRNVNFSITSRSTPISRSTEKNHVRPISGKFRVRVFFRSLLVRGHFQEVAKLFTFAEFSRNLGFLKSLATSHLRAAAPKNGVLKAACGAGFGPLLFFTTRGTAL